MCVAKAATHILPFVIRFVTTGRQDMTTSALFIASQSACLADRATHQHENLHIFTATGAFYLRQPGSSLALLASVNQHFSSHPTLLQIHGSVFFKNNSFAFQPLSLGFR